MAAPSLIVVTGPPGSGKTTLAHELARLIPCPAVCRNEIKERMVHAHGVGFEPGVVRCTVDPDVSFERATGRGLRRAAHGDSALQIGIEQWRENVASFGWITIPAPTISVDATDGYAPALADVAAFVSSPA